MVDEKNMPTDNPLPFANMSDEEAMELIRQIPEVEMISKEEIFKNNPKDFFTWFQKEFVKGFSFGTEEKYTRMSSGGLVPLRPDGSDTLTIHFNDITIVKPPGDRGTSTIDINSPASIDLGFVSNRAIIKFRVIKIPLKRIKVEATCRTNDARIIEVFEAVWNEILKDHDQDAGQNALPSKPKKLLTGSSLLDKLLPKDEKTIERFRKAWKIYRDMCKEYQVEVLDGQSNSREPTIQDFRTRVIREMKWQVGERRLSTVIQLGEAGLLKK